MFVCKDICNQIHNIFLNMLWRGDTSPRLQSNLKKRNTLPWIALPRCCRLKQYKIRWMEERRKNGRINNSNKNNACTVLNLLPYGPFSTHHSRVMLSGRRVPSTRSLRRANSPINKSRTERMWCTSERASTFNNPQSCYRNGWGTQSIN